MAWTTKAKFNFMGLMFMLMLTLSTACQKTSNLDKITVKFKHIKTELWDDYSREKLNQILSESDNNNLNDSKAEQLALLALTHNELSLATELLIYLNEHTLVPDYAYYLADLAIAKNKFSDANAYIINALSKADNNDKNQLYLLRAKMLIANGEIDKANKTLKQVLKIDANNLEGIYLTAKTKLLSGDCQSAINKFQHLIKALPQLKQFNAPLASAYRMCGQQELADQYSLLTTEESIQFQNRFIDKKQSIGNPVMNLKNNIKVFISRKDYSQAIVLLNKLISIEPNEPSNHINLGSMYFNLKNINAAKSAYLNALKLNSESLMALQNIAIVSMLEKDLTAAEKYLSQALNIKANHPQVLLNLASVKQDLNKPAEAEPLLISLLEVDAQHTGGRTSLIRSLCMQSKYQDAIKTINKWSLKEPDSQLLLELTAKVMLQHYSPDIQQIDSVLDKMKSSTLSSKSMVSSYLLLETKNKLNTPQSEVLDKFQAMTSYTADSIETYQFSLLLQQLQDDGYLDEKIFK